MLEDPDLDVQINALTLINVLRDQAPDDFKRAKFKYRLEKLGIVKTMKVFAVTQCVSRSLFYAPIASSSFSDSRARLTKTFRHRWPAFRNSPASLYRTRGTSAMLCANASRLFKVSSLLPLSLSPLPTYFLFFPFLSLLFLPSSFLPSPQRPEPFLLLEGSRPYLPLPQGSIAP